MRKKLSKQISWACASSFQSLAGSLSLCCCVCWCRLILSFDNRNNSLNQFLFYFWDSHNGSFLYFAEFEYLMIAWSPSCPEWMCLFCVSRDLAIQWCVVSVWLISSTLKDSEVQTRKFQSYRRLRFTRILDGDHVRVHSCRHKSIAFTLPFPHNLTMWKLDPWGTMHVVIFKFSFIQTQWHMIDEFKFTDTTTERYFVVWWKSGWCQIESPSKGTTEYLGKIPYWGWKMENRSEEGRRRIGRRGRNHSRFYVTRQHKHSDRSQFQH